MTSIHVATASTHKKAIKIVTSNRALGERVSVVPILTSTTVVPIHNSYLIKLKAIITAGVTSCVIVCVVSKNKHNMGMAKS